tara:strand:+ start:3323 stop:3502 length:180 start_codon:yes stop_codon:yes gene_type:complete
MNLPATNHLHEYRIKVKNYYREKQIQKECKERKKIKGFTERGHQVVWHHIKINSRGLNG